MNIVRYEDDATTNTAVATGQQDYIAAAMSVIPQVKKANPSRDVEAKFSMKGFPLRIGLRQNESEPKAFSEPEAGAGCQEPNAGRQHRQVRSGERSSAADTEPRANGFFAPGHRSSSASHAAGPFHARNHRRNLLRLTYLRLFRGGEMVRLAGMTRKATGPVIYLPTSNICSEYSWGHPFRSRSPRPSCRPVQCHFFLCRPSSLLTTTLFHGLPLPRSSARDITAPWGRRRMGRMDWLWSPSLARTSCASTS